MNAAYRYARGLLLSLGCFYLAGAAQAQISEAQAEKLMRLSGQWEQLALIAGQMRDGLVQGLATGEKAPAAEVQARIKAAATAAFTADRVQREARRTMAQSLRTSFTAEVQRWYESPTARRITQVEVEETARDQEDLTVRTQRGMAVVNAATPQRQLLLLRLVEVTRAPRVSADLVINMGVVLPIALLRFDPQAKAATEAQLRAALEEQREVLTKAFETITLAGFAITYRDLPDEALAAYGNFMAGAAGEHFTDIGERASEAAILAAITALKP